MTRPARRRRILQLAPSVPVADTPHAGGRLQADIVRQLVADGASVVVLVPSEPIARDELARALPGVLALDPEQGMAGSRAASFLLRVSHRANALIRRTPLERIHAPFVLALLLRPQVRDLFRGADVIDLQWFEVIGLAPLVRLLGGRGTRVVGTFHDVMSQRLERLAAVARDPAEAGALRSRARALRPIEAWLVGALDRAVVLSGKDRDLLVAEGAPAGRITVLDPQIDAPPRAAAPDTVPPRGTAPGHVHRVLLVGWMARPENIDAATWMIEEIWPLVRRSAPAAELRIVGGGAPQALRDLVARTPGASSPGFVEDLGAEYAAAGCAVIPLRDGAGIKFKTIEALLHAVPTVATPIGAEGVGADKDFVAVSADPTALAAGIVAALREPSHRDRARRTAARLVQAHSASAFRDTVRTIYGFGQDI